MSLPLYSNFFITHVQYQNMSFDMIFYAFHVGNDHIFIILFAPTKTMSSFAIQQIALDNCWYWAIHKHWNVQMKQEYIRIEQIRERNKVLSVSKEIRFSKSWNLQILLSNIDFWIRNDIIVSLIAFIFLN